jgi:hypothetical protein
MDGGSSGYIMIMDGWMKKCTGEGWVTYADGWMDEKMDG